MSLRELAHDGVTIVLVGRFNPAIFSPAWLLSQGLIGSPEFEGAKTELIVPDFAIFETGWLRCEVRNDRLQVSTNDEAEFERVRDVAVGILRTLSHTPIALLGINRHIHFAVNGADEWHAVGDALTQKDVWDGVLKLPGMRGVTIWGVRPDLYAGRVQVQVEPSNVMSYGIYLSHNDHFSLSKVESQPNSRDELLGMAAEKVVPHSDKIPIAIEILTNEFGHSLQRGLLVAERVFDQAEAKQ